VSYDWCYAPNSWARYRIHSNRLTANDLASGDLARSLRQGIEITDSYLPPQSRSQITAQARRYNFNYCLRNALIPLQAGNVTGTLRLLQETLKLDRSPQAIATLFEWLTQDAAAAVRSAIVSELFSLG
jgi:hypothetical protein